jgi:hypothetical protein
MRYYHTGLSTSGDLNTDLFQPSFQLASEFMHRWKKGEIARHRIRGTGGEDTRLSHASAKKLAQSTRTTDERRWTSKY